MDRPPGLAGIDLRQAVGRRIPFASLPGVEDGRQDGHGSLAVVFQEIGQAQGREPARAVEPFFGVHPDEAGPQVGVAA